MLVNLVIKRREAKTLYARKNGRLVGRVSGEFDICKNSNLTIGKNCKGKNTCFVLKDSTVTIGDDCYFNNIKIEAVKSKITIGNRNIFAGHTVISSHEACSISIGDDCLIAGGTWITTSDMHSIIDARTNERLNYAQPIKIGNRVWLAAEVLIFKGSTIGDGAAIGARAIVTKEIPAHSLAVGAPARPIRHEISWRRDLI